MTPEKINIAIAELCPTIFTVKNKLVYWHCCHQKAGLCISPINDLNAMAEVRKSLTRDEQNKYVHHLETIVATPKANLWSWALLDATAPQHCEAYLKTKSKWIP